jgi:hypothetical protein
VSLCKCCVAGTCNLFGVTYGRPAWLYGRKVNANHLGFRMEISNVNRPYACTCTDVKNSLRILQLGVCEITTEDQAKDVMLEI